jgi:tRNA(Leu) C34 or U34 (ribose-2'-O)-methylase TrmL
MSSYFEYKTDFPEEVKARDDGQAKVVLCQAWSNGTNATLAVGTATGHVLFFGDEGESIPNTSFNRTPSKCLCMQWHPKHEILATGWDNGEFFPIFTCPPLYTILYAIYTCAQ